MQPAVLKNQDLALLGTAQIETLADRIAPTDLNVLISGETGVGKRSIAERIHSNSRRHDQPLVIIRCKDVPSGAICDGLDEFSDRLNHAFLASSPKSSFRGTLFFENVEHLHPRSQAALFQIVEGAGADRSKAAIDVRVLCSSECDLVDMAARKLFRSDLLYRLKVGHLPIPPLRKRKDEIPLLVNRCLRRYEANYGGAARAVFDSREIQMLKRYDWPGNLAELDDFIKSFVGLGSKVMAFRLLEQKIKGQERHLRDESSLEELSQMAEKRAERRIIERVLDRTAGDARKAAQFLHMTPAALEQKMSQLQLDPSGESEEINPASFGVR